MLQTKPLHCIILRLNVFAFLLMCALKTATRISKENICISNSFWEGGERESIDSKSLHTHAHTHDCMYDFRFPSSDRPHRPPQPHGSDQIINHNFNKFHVNVKWRRAFTTTTTQKNHTRRKITASMRIVVCYAYIFLVWFQKSMYSCVCM